MKTFTMFIVSLSLAFTSMTCLSGIHKAEDRINAKLSSTKARYKYMSEFMGDYIKDMTKKDKSQCGNLSIGNIQGSRPGRKQTKELIVFVQGDVIMADNKCR